jgi:hypothetical protein
VNNTEPEGIRAIRAFLAAVRRRSLLRAGLQTAGYGLAVVVVTLLALALVANAVGPASFWPTLTAIVAALFAAAALAYGLVRPAHALRRAEARARHAGTMLADTPVLASDLLSAVQLGAAVRRDALPTGVSASLVQAFQEQVAAAVAPVQPRRLVSLRPALWAVGAGALAAAGLVAAGTLSPTLGRGLATLVHHPSLFEGAVVSPVPLVGDVRIIYTYPPYTGLPPRTVEGSTGDLAAVKGTHVRIETRPLHPARRALLLLGERGDRGEIDATLSGGALVAELTLTTDAVYRFWLQPSFGRPVREERSHRLTAEADAAPRVDILGPADRLELTTPRPIEIGYSASDDYGLGAVDLVYRVGDAPEQRVPLRDGAGARSVQGRTLWDPASANLVGGAERIAYHVEARDRDEVSGAKVGMSRTLYVVIQNPHESLEDRLERQRDLLEKLVGDLGDRLERVPGQPAAPEGAGTQASGDVPAAVERLTGLTVVHENEESHLALLGQLIDEDRRNPSLGKPLRAALAAMADRLERLLREETQALGGVRGKTASGGVPSAAVMKRLDAISGRHVTELENDVLTLDDLIGRQRLEDLATLGKELTDAYQRLTDLLERYKKTKDEALRRQLEREARELRARIADLAQKIAEVRARNDVPEEWRNLPDMKGLADQARKLDEMLERGQEADLEKALAELGEDLRGVRKMLDQNLEGFGAERFPQENRVIADLMKKIGDIEGDERALEKETQAIAEKQEAETERRLKGELEELLKKENEKVERLKQRLAGVPTGDPEGALAEDVNRARESSKQIKRLLAERDLSEAKGEAERAESALDRAADHLEETAEARRAHRTGPDADKDKSAEAVGEARGLAREIAEDLAKLLPRGSETISPQDREAARAQSERQGAIGKRTDDVASEAARKLGKGANGKANPGGAMPGMDKAESELRGAAARMRQAADALRRDESKAAATAERDAADRLQKLRDSMQERQMGGGRQHRDPVRIPGADESAAPRAWRQELLDAMKEKAPEKFRDEVRRYYEELVK